MKKINNRPQLDIKTLRKNPEVMDRYSNRVEQTLTDKCGNIENNVDEISEKITIAIQTSSMEEIPPKDKKRDEKPWANDTFVSLVKERNNKKYRKERDDLNKQITKMSTKLKNEYYAKKASLLNEASVCRGVEEEFRRANDYKASKSTSKVTIAADKLKNHFEEHFAPRDVTIQPEVVNSEQFAHILPPDDLEVNENSPTEEELKASVKSLKNNKCAGTDQIYAEQLKYCTSSKLITNIMLLLACIWSSISVPKSWLEAIITCLHKKGPKNIAKNYRSIFIMNTISRLLPIIIMQRLRNVYEKVMMKSQFGFRKNRSTTDAIFIVREAIRSTKQPLYLCMIDLRAAYDHIDRNMMFKVLSIRTKAPKLVNILKAVYTGTIAAIKHTVDQFQIHTGCRQGGIESPMIFNIYMDFVLRCAEHEVQSKYPESGLKYSYQINIEASTREQRKLHGLRGNDWLRMLLYADDIVLFCENIEELQGVIDIYNRTFKQLKTSDNSNT